MKSLAKSHLRYAGVSLAAATLLVVQVACSYKKAEAPTPTCAPPAVVSYKSDVRPILVTNCQSKCHNDQDAFLYKNFSMEHFDQVHYWATTTPGGSFTESYLVGNVDHLPGYAYMPSGAAQLSECDRAIIRNWVKQGALNN